MLAKTMENRHRNNNNNNNNNKKINDNKVNTFYAKLKI